jgi:iron complex outermembrane receptor protein
MSRFHGSIRKLKCVLFLGTSITALCSAAPPTAAADISDISADTPIVLAQAAAPAPETVALAAPSGPAISIAVPEQVLVTGTRAVGLTAADSAAPIAVVGSEALAHVAVPDLNFALEQQVPSVLISNGGDLGAFVVMARLRGISPNDTLVLVNGKRLHTTADFEVGGGTVQGGFAPDFSMIPLASVDHVEVLLDGAAAQYGSDAIAGVVNIILKSGSEAGVASANVGSYYSTAGANYDLTINKGLPLGDSGFINLTYEKKYQDFARTFGFGDKRVTDQNGNAFTDLGYDPKAITGFPVVNPTVYSPWYEQSNYSYNSGYDIGSAIHAYSFGTYNTRRAEANENLRVPSLIVGVLNPATGKQILGSSGTIGKPNTIVPFPNGFVPQEEIAETNYTTTFGVKGVIGGLSWDLSTTYGRDEDKSYTINSANRSLYLNTGFTPDSFYDGDFIATEWTNNLDFTDDWDIGFAQPVVIAFGAEERENVYTIKQGDAASTYLEGGQSFPGFLSTDAGTHDRKNYAGYLDLVIFPIEPLQIEIAGRYEHYTDFGNAPVGKITARYDLSPSFALRGTAATGFRAPTLAEEFYSATNVSPTTAIVQLPPNSAAAALLGVKPLQPEHSTDYSVGFLGHLGDNFDMSLDAYSISLRDRIAATGTLAGSVSGVIQSAAVNAAIAAHGNVLDPSVVNTGTTGVSIFVNGLSTDTKGVDFTANYRTDFEQYGQVTWTLAANWNETKITFAQTTTPQLAGSNFFSAASLRTLTNGSPREKISFGANWVLDKWRVHVQERMYGPTSAFVSPTAVAPFFTNEVPVSFLTDLDINYLVTDHITITLGATNLFNKIPPLAPNVVGAGSHNGSLVPDTGNVYGVPINGAYGRLGGAYYLRTSYTF